MGADTLRVSATRYRGETMEVRGGPGLWRRCGEEQWKIGLTEPEQMWGGFAVSLVLPFVRSAPALVLAGALRSTLAGTKLVWRGEAVRALWG